MQNPCPSVLSLILCGHKICPSPKRDRGYVAVIIYDEIDIYRSAMNIGIVSLSAQILNHAQKCLPSEGDRNLTVLS